MKRTYDYWREYLIEKNGSPSVIYESVARAMFIEAVQSDDNAVVELLRPIVEKQLAA